ncbi:MAG: biotin/lipoyl-binding protein [Kineosporiaceae bacterium]|nr:biotin/lipoyl-binding protein [Kineosporiaceae bacterium]MBK7622829.1 biotin/lipoyl-binding protein [Kineosporiaceae bacterium]MBK8078099.1 biotin/lipoyl-binding protein [Kineosporiaceae bacterium]
MKLKVTVNGMVYDVEVEVAEEAQPTFAQLAMASPTAYGVTPTAARAPATASSSLTAPIAGTVVKVLVEGGAEVTAGQTLLVLEAMKMETEITAPHDGTVATVEVTVGATVGGGQPLLTWA